jgi:ATP-dependent RNA helicase RhlE
MGFHDDILQIIEHLNAERQNLLFSATMPPEIRQLAKKILTNPVEINISLAKPAEGILQTIYRVENPLKTKLIVKLLSGKDLTSILIFCSTKNSVKILEKELTRLGFNTKAIHSDLVQKEREQVLLEFKNRKVQILVATDVISRGIDIENIDLIINYDTPQDAEDYVHRVGRTARAQATGVAITLVSKKEERIISRIEKLIGYSIFRSPLPPDVGRS